MPTPALTVHHLESSRSHRVLWLLEELGLPYEVVRYPRNPKTLRAPPALKKIHPLGKSPVLTDGPSTLAESAAILEYLVDTYGQAAALVPAAGTPELLRYRYFMHYAEGSLMPYLVMKLVFTRLPRSIPALIRPVAKLICNGAQRGFVDPQLRDHLGFLEAELTQRKYFTGDSFSVADIQMGYPMEAAATRASAIVGPTPNISDWLMRVRARPAFQRALQRGGELTSLG